MEYKFSDRVSNLKPSAIREIFKYAADPEVVSLSAEIRPPTLSRLRAIAENFCKCAEKQPYFRFAVQCERGLYSAEKSRKRVYEKGA